MARQEAHITGSVLTWAIDESGLSRDEVADKLKVGVSDVKAWESETARPSKGNLTNLAKSLHRPSAIFYLPDPPKSASLPTSFRHAPSLGGHTLNHKELLEIRKAGRLQSILSWIQVESDENPCKIPHFSIEDNHEEAGKQVRGQIGVSMDKQFNWENYSQAFREWRSVLTNFEIIVLQVSLGKESIRGFAIWDEFTPLIAVNTAYHQTARIFTLFHEVGHLVLRSSSPCYEFVSPEDTDRKTERWCEEFAAAYLMPHQDFINASKELGITPNAKVTDINVARKISNRFKVSTRAASLRLEKLGLAHNGFYNSISRELDNFDLPSKGGGGGGRTTIQKRIDEIGANSISLIFKAREQNLLNELDVTDYLNLTTGQTDDLREIVH